MYCIVRGHTDQLPRHKPLPAHTRVTSDKDTIATTASSSGGKKDIASRSECARTPISGTTTGATCYSVASKQETNGSEANAHINASRHPQDTQAHSPKPWYFDREHGISSVDAADDKQIIFESRSSCSSSSSRSNSSSSSSNSSSTSREREVPKHKQETTQQKKATKSQCTDSKKCSRGAVEEVVECDGFGSGHSKGVGSVNSARVVCGVECHGTSCKEEGGQIGSREGDEMSGSSNGIAGQQQIRRRYSRKELASRKQELKAERKTTWERLFRVLQCVAVYCIALQCIVLCCSVLRCVTEPHLGKAILYLSAVSLSFCDFSPPPLLTPPLICSREPSPHPPLPSPTNTTSVFESILSRARTLLRFSKRFSESIHGNCTCACVPACVRIRVYKCPDPQ